MARKEAASGKAARNDRLKIFISYSRTDAAAADALVTALEARGFEVTIDKRNLPFGEEWQKELAEFIRLSDTVIWLVSKPSIESKWVNWELDEVKARNKRLVPVMVGLVNPAELPRQLGAIHILPPDRVFDLARDLDTLVQVLETDHAWLKQATRWQDRAAVWIANKRGSGRLLSSGELKDAERWKGTRPAKAPAPAQEVLDLLLASRQAANLRQRWMVGGSLAAAVVAIGLAGLAYLQSVEADRQRSEAVEQRGVAETQTKVAEEQRRITDVVRKEAQTTDSGLLSRAAKAITDEPLGDLPLAMLLALEGLPDQTSNDPRVLIRDWVPEAWAELDRSYRRVREVGFLRYDGGVNAISWSPDGRFVATASRDKTARLYDLSAQVEVARFAHDSIVASIAWRPDGRALATGSGHAARVFDISEKSEIASFAHDGEVKKLSWSWDGKVLATASTDQNERSAVRVLDIARNTETARFSHKGGAPSMALSPDGRALATSSTADNTTFVFDVADATVTARFVDVGEVNHIAWRPDGRALATASNDKIARVFDVTTKAQVARFAHEGRVWGIAWSPDGQFVATASDEAARVFDVAGQSEVAQFALGGPVWEIAWSPDGRMLATRSFGRTAQVLDIGTASVVSRFVHDGAVLSIAWSPDGRAIATGSMDGTARVFDVGRTSETVRFKPENGVGSIALSSDGRHLASLSHRGATAQVFDLIAQEKVARLTDVWSIAWRPDGRALATASRDKTARVLDIATKTVVAELAHDGLVYEVAWSPDGRFLATASQDNKARVFEMGANAEVASFGFTGRVSAVAWSPDGRFLATWSGAVGLETARVFDLVARAEVTWFSEANDDDWMQLISWSPGGRFVAITWRDKTARVYDLSARSEIARFSHDGPIRAIAWSSDGRTLATLSNNAARVFDIAARTEVARLDHNDRVNSIAWSPNGQALATGSDDKSARIFDMADKAAAASFLHDFEVKQVVWSPDGRALTTRTTGNTVRMFHIGRATEVAQFPHYWNVHAVAWSPLEPNADGALSMVTMSGDETLHLWHVGTSPQALINMAKRRARRCLTQAQRKQYFLPSAPPTWCVERRLWPYHGDEWQGWLPKQKAWFASGRQGEAPALPKAQ